METIFFAKVGFHKWLVSVIILGIFELLNVSEMILENQSATSLLGP